MVRWREWTGVGRGVLCSKEDKPKSSRARVSFFSNTGAAQTIRSSRNEYTGGFAVLIFPRYCGHTEGLGRIINLGGVKWKNVRVIGSTVRNSRKRQYD